jgi:nucleoside 2-deoxyribosyltransferase
MNIYFSCSITGGRDDQQIYEAIVNSLLAEGHVVPTAILASKDVLAYETVIGPADVFQRDTAWVENCDAVVAEVSTPSHGVGYEIALALSLGKPVLCCYKEGKRVSKMILGNNHPKIKLAIYDQPEDAVACVHDFLQAI